jgi:hypothetical protein
MLEISKGMEDENKEQKRKMTEEEMDKKKQGN